MKQSLINNRHYVVLYLTLAVSMIFSFVNFGWEMFYTTIWYEQSASFYIVYYTFTAPGCIYFFYRFGK